MKISLTEFTPEYLMADALGEEQAVMLHRQWSAQITVEWPNPTTGRRWCLTSKGVVGYIPLSDESGIALQPKVPLSNLFGMLEYAYDLASFRLLEGKHDVDEMRDIYERLAGILAQRTLDRVRNGLYKTYRTESDQLSFVRGRIDMVHVMHSPVHARLMCQFEEHTVDVPDNRILAWTLHRIERSGVCRAGNALTVRRAGHALRHAVALQHHTASDCDHRTYSRLNDDYEVLHKLCRFFLENTGPTIDSGDRRMFPFLVDMASLFEAFVYRWLQMHLDSRFTVRAQETIASSGADTIRMRTDLVIRDATIGAIVCVLDTKYKEAEAISHSDFYQMVTYAHTLGCAQAVLVYPHKLDHPFETHVRGICVRGVPFDISGDLEEGGTILLSHLDRLIDSHNEHAGTRVV